MKRNTLFTLLAGLSMLSATQSLAQRTTDHLDRGLVAMKTSSGVQLSWRIQADEYYDVSYNIYRDGTKLNEEPLTVSNFQDKSGSLSSTYTIKAVMGGKEQEACRPASVWSSSYKEIKLNHEGIASTLIPNDACCADVDGDGELEILMKFDNGDEISQSYPKEGPVIDGKSTREYSIFECLKLDGTRLWWVNCGPNMGDFQNNEQNIVGYDWDQDGKAEVVMRLAEGSTIHYADGKTYTIGVNGQNSTSFTNYRAANGGDVNWFVHDGKEFLVYCNGQTGEVYQCIDFPLARLESGETGIKSAWGDDSGHRCSKFFFGAPYLDGRKPSIFLARGIYTRHKMAALDVDPATHKLTLRWKWYNNTNGSWKGQGYHNFAIADVDCDGRDEIVYGSMVIDDNGKGLSTTGYGHGDAQHCGDLNPYVHGQEQFCCNEDAKGFNYRDATTSKVYAATLQVGKDVGRAMADNFTESFPGSLGTAWGCISTVTNGPVDNLSDEGVHSNFRIYWDGDLVSETFNYSNGVNSAGAIYKYGSWSPIYTCVGSMTNNDTKGTPCYQGDILGDWREEIVMRTADNNIRIYSTPSSTTWRIPSLWYDHQYRNAMVWQMCGYNQPPHPSFFLGKTDGITVAPPPLTMTGRVEVKSGETINASHNGQDVIVCETSNSSIAMEQGVSPRLLIFNVPTWVQGTAPSECSSKEYDIQYTTYTCNVSGGTLSGPSRLVKQGDGVLTLPKTNFTHTGPTDIWAGTLNFDGTMAESDLWLNRFAELNSQGGTFKSIKAEYASVIRPGGANTKGNIVTNELTLGFGSRIVVDLYADDFTSDQLQVGQLNIETKSGTMWETAGPTYLSPVIELVGHLKTGEASMTPGKYTIATISGTTMGSVGSIVLEGLSTSKKLLYIEEGKLILEIVGMRESTDIVWTGSQSNWDLAESHSFLLNDDEPTVFVSGDNVTFNDNTSSRIVTVVGSLIPNTFTVNHSGAAYTIKGDGGIDGNAHFVKEGSGKVYMKTNSLYTGGNELNGGTTSVTLLSNAFSEVGNLGGITGPGKFVIRNGAELNSTEAVEMGSPITLETESGGIITNAKDFKMDASFDGTLLTKKGAGTLFLNAGNASLQKLAVNSGAVAIAANASPLNIDAIGNCTLWDDGTNTTVPINVAKGKTCTWNLTYTNYTVYSNKITGEGTLTIVPRNNVNRVRITGDWSSFYGTIKQTTNIWLPLDMTINAPHATLDIASGCGVAQVPGRSWTIGALTGKGDLTNSGCDFKSQSKVTGQVTFNVGNDDGKHFTFEGTITNRDANNTTAFNKVGSCKMTHKGLGSFSGACNIKAGELCLNKVTSEAMLGTGTLSVASGATLSGNGALGNSSTTISNGALLQAGISESTVGTLKFSSNNLIVNGTLQLYVSSATSFGKLIGIQKLTLGTGSYTPTLVIKGKSGLALTEGTELQIFEATSFASNGKLKFDLCQPNESDPTLIWDTTELTTTGKIKVIKDPEATAIRSITDDALKHSTIYTIDGKRLETTPKQRGIYIVNGVKTLIK